MLDLDRNAYGESFSMWSANAENARAGGDWCAVIPISNDAVALTIGDVAGHGAGAAARMSMLRATILNALASTQVPSDILQAANDAAFVRGHGALLVTAIVAIFDRRTRTLTFANAGHPPPLVIGTEHAFLKERSADLPLGVFVRHRAANYVVALPSDALLVLYTDGLTEHNRDPIGGESELVEAARWAYERPLLDPARAVATYVLHRARGGDDAAAITLRLHSDVPAH